MFDLKSYILGMIFMAVMTFLDKPIMSLLEKHKATNSAKKKS
jgi:ABC-type branched-subunit amino acid transport system permease subunit